MSKNAFTPDGGPHRYARVIDVADGLKRMGEFERAEMLTNYASLLHEREAAKAVMTDELIHAAWLAFDGTWFSDRVIPEAQDRMRRTIEAVAPMLVSAQVPDAMEPDFTNPPYDEGYADGWNACRAAMLATTPKPEANNP